MVTSLADTPAPGKQTLNPKPGTNVNTNTDNLRGGGSYGPTPMMNAGMTFAEVGSLGLRAWSGWVREEFLPELIGRQGAQKYREMSDNSPTIGAIIYAIKSTMRKVEWRVTPAGAEENKATSPEAQEAADFVQSCMDDMTHSWEDLVDENLSMLVYGYAPHEIVYKKRMGRDPGMDPNNPGEELPKSEYDDGRIGWRRMPIRGQDTVLKWFFDRNGQIKGLTQQPWIGPLLDIPIEKMLLFRPWTHKNNPEGRSVLRTAYLSYYFMKRLQEMEAIVGERLGGVPVLQVPSYIFDAANSGDAKAVAALQSYKKIATNVRVDEQMGIVLPSDVWTGPNGAASAAKQFEFQLVTPTGRPMGGFDFDKTIQRYSTYMFTSVMADFLMLGQRAHGTQSLADNKVDMFFQSIEGYLNSMAAVYNRHALPRLWKLNGFDFENMPKITPDLAQRVDLDVLSNFVLRMSQSGMPLFPNEELQTYIMDAAGLPDVVDEEALQAAGLLTEQLDQKDEQSDVMLENLKNPPMAKPGGPNAPGRTNLEKMLLAGVAKRMLRGGGPKFGIHTHKRDRTVHLHKTNGNGTYGPNGGQGASPFPFGIDEWRDHVIYIYGNEQILKSVLAGEFDDLTDDKYSQAIRHIQKFNQLHRPKGPGGGQFAPGTIYTDDVEVAAKALAQNRKVVLSQPKTVSVLIEKLGSETRRMVEMGQKAPNYNLCNVYLAGSNLFCAETKGIPRPKMPQFKGGKGRRAFIDYLEGKGYATTKEKVRSDYLRATQDELNGAKVAGIAEKMRGSAPAKLGRTIVSSDNYILDGHHRWAAQVANDTIDGTLGGSTTRVRRVDIPITTLLEEAKLYGAATEAVNKLGLDPESDEHAQAVLDEIAKFNPFHVQSGPQGGEFTSGEGGGSGSANKPSADPSRSTRARIVTADQTAKIRRKLGDKAGADLLHFFDTARLMNFKRPTLYQRKMGAIKEFIARYPEYKGRTESLFNLLPDYPVPEGAHAFKRDVEKFNPHHVEHGEHGGEFTSGANAMESALNVVTEDSFYHERNLHGTQDSHGLNVNERGALYQWLGNGYRDLRTEPSFGKVLGKLPEVHGKVFRGTRLNEENLSKLKVGSVYNIEKFSSASQRRDVAVGFISEGRHDPGKKIPVVFEINDSGRKIPRVYAETAGTDDEAEVVLMRGDRYKINAIDSVHDETGPTYTRVQMSQVT